MLVEPIFLMNLSSSLFMTGLIWVIQLAHYPSFRFVDESEYTSFQQFHETRITFIVLPVMLIEIITSGYLWFSDGWTSVHGIGFVLVLLIWISTAVFSVPYHAQLSKGKDVATINKLVNTNWIRTVLWSSKSMLTLWILYTN